MDKLSTEELADFGRAHLATEKRIKELMTLYNGTARLNIRRDLVLGYRVDMTYMYTPKGCQDKREGLVCGEWADTLCEAIKKLHANLIPPRAPAATTNKSVEDRLTRIEDALEKLTDRLTKE